MDGMTNDAWELKELKTFQRIQNEGIRADYMTPVYQSTTYPGHVSMATGVYPPDRHGILHNSFYDRESGFHSYPNDANLIDSPPIWVLAEQEGITTGVYFGLVQRHNGMVGRQSINTPPLMRTSKKKKKLTK